MLNVYKLAGIMTTCSQSLKVEMRLPYRRERALNALLIVLVIAVVVIYFSMKR